MEKTITKIQVNKESLVNAIKGYLTNPDNESAYVDSNGDINFYGFNDSISGKAIAKVQEFIFEDYQQPLISSEWDFDSSNLEQGSEEYNTAQWEAYCDYVENDLSGEIKTWLNDEFTASFIDGYGEEIETLIQVEYI